MTIEIKVPVLPESVADAIMMEWHKNVGDAVTREENLVDVETEKVVLEVPAPDDGVLLEILKPAGETVLSGEVIARIEPGAVATPQAEPIDATTDTAVAQTESTSTDETVTDTGEQSPAVRRLLAEHNINAASVTASGKDGRITKEDVLQHIENQSTAPAPAQSAAAPVETNVDNTESDDARAERREPMTRLRQTIARRLVESQQNAALLTTFNEVDLFEVMALRRKYKESFEKTHGAKLGFMSFFVKAAVAGLKRFPVINAYVDGTDIVYHDYHDVGIAVSSPRGLVVPIVRDCEQKSFAEIETSIANYGQKARDGKLGMDDLMGGTFTITNGGVFGSLVSTPIINPPQSAILGMHKIQERPMVMDGEIVARPMMYLALSYDHRIIDGREAVQFLVTVKDSLEDPARLLLSV